MKERRLPMPAAAPLALVAVAVVSTGCPEERDLVEVGCSADPDEGAVTPEMLTAFFGLDDVPGNVGDPVSFDDLCPRALGLGRVDGMPVVTSVLLDATTLDPEDFEITTERGRTYAPECVTLEPATDDCEGRTILLIGELGDDPDDPPETIEIVGEVRARDGRDLQDTAGPIDVIALLDGPTLVLAEEVAPADVGAPAGTEIAVRAVWAGGVVALNDEEVTEAEWGWYQLTVLTDAQETQTVSPFDVGDLGDGDNNHLLFFDVAGTPEALSLPAGLVMDPNDVANPATAVAVRPWQAP